MEHRIPQISFHVPASKSLLAKHKLINSQSPKTLEHKLKNPIEQSSKSS
jgi:hypothetical protein